MPTLPNLELITLGPVLQKPVNLTLGHPKIKSEFSNGLFMNLEIFFRKSCPNQYKFLLWCLGVNRRTEIHNLKHWFKL